MESIITPQPHRLVSSGSEHPVQSSTPALAGTSDGGSSPPSHHLSTPEEISSFVDQMDTFIFDCDGVLWLGNDTIKGAPEFLHELVAKGKRIIYVTNNSSKSRKTYVGKFKKLGFPAEPDNIFGSAYAAAYYLKNMLNFPADKKVYVVGMQGIVDELAEMGIQAVGAGDDNAPLQETEFENGTLGPDESIGAVLLGFDSQINYRKYAKAFTYLTANKGKVHFLATNEDRTYPISGSIYPGTGSLLAALIHSVNRRPDAVLGKPSQNMMNTILERFHLDPARTCMVGDRLDTDIAFGKLGKLHTLLVMTGVTSVEERDAKKGPVTAEYWIESVGHLRQR
ncbi:4-nitrophenylphosphatase [Gonapodya prolifera JEL478]|uniref:4-nitrophenylphosphatase n=1 Tax=Gonapodya prolifera (strain JEL478) TaxID=1344416 RepID=A0A139AUC4_GONPJ|nr:4-nitrophenylphosphatase [Gonapodya prolifera JEL478]|eukprot:KXS20095.1 4-nitrophenylphosphatase [Gonapodya prolifera JEL478]